MDNTSICEETGLLPRAGCPVITEYFDVGTLPTEYCDQHFYEPPEEEFIEYEVTPTPEGEMPNPENPDGNGENQGGDGSDENPDGNDGSGEYPGGDDGSGENQGGDGSGENSGGDNGSGENSGGDDDIIYYD